MTDLKKIKHDWDSYVRRMNSNKFIKMARVYRLSESRNPGQRSEFGWTV